MRQYYPEIYLPNELAEYNSNWRKYIYENNRPINPILPTEPIKPEKYKFSSVVVIYISAISFVIGYAFTKELNYGILGFALSAVLYTLYAVFKTHIEFPKLINEHYAKIITYNNELDEYEKLAKQAIQDYEKLNANYKNTEWREQQRVHWQKDLLSAKNNSLIDFKNPKVGKSESTFLNILNAEFPDLIFINKTIQVFNYKEKINFDYDFDIEFETQKKSNAYVPDFVLHVPSHNLYIDVEIDEQFNSNGVPIHSLNNLHDKKRNNYFLDYNWIIIRFSESQIQNFPKECCKEIAFIINDTLGIKSYSNKLLNINRLICIPKHGSRIVNNLSERKYISIEDMNGKWESGDDRYTINENKFIIDKKISLTEFKLYQTGEIKFFENFDSRISISFSTENALKKFELRNWISEETLVLMNISTKDYMTLNKIK